MEQELAEERAAAEIEAQRAQEAIQAKQQELQRIEQQRQYEVCFCCLHAWKTLLLCLYQSFVQNACLSFITSLHMSSHRNSIRLSSACMLYC